LRLAREGDAARLGDLFNSVKPGKWTV